MVLQVELSIEETALDEVELLERVPDELFEGFAVGRICNGESFLQVCEQRGDVMEMRVDTRNAGCEGSEIGYRFYPGVVLEFVEFDVITRDFNSEMQSDALAEQIRVNEERSPAESEAGFFQTFAFDRAGDGFVNLDFAPGKAPIAGENWLVCGALHEKKAAIMNSSEGDGDASGDFVSYKLSYGSISITIDKSE
jgi:hypothetical protein